MAAHPRGPPPTTSAALLRGYLSTRTVVGAEKGSRGEMMLHAENQELIDAAAGSSRATTAYRRSRWR